MTVWTKTLSGLALLFALAFFMPTLAQAEGEVGDDGLHKQSWFLESFLDLREDVNEAKAKGKRLAIIWEQKGCPYCAETHTKNLAISEISNYIKENFDVIQLNLWGDREVTDFDGEVTTEKKLARKWGVVFTPTIHFPVDANELIDGKPGIQQMAATMPGYFKPFHFIRMFEWVKTRRYESQHFQKYIAEMVKKYHDEGKDVKMW